MNILILGGRSFVALEWARALAPAHEVHVADSTRFFVSRFSKAVCQWHRYPSPRHRLNAFRDWLVNIIETHRVDWVIPTCEEAFHLAQVVDQLPSSCRYLVDSIAQLTQLHSKYELRHLLGADFDYPQTQRFTAGAVRLVPEQQLIKPEYGRFNQNVVDAAQRPIATQAEPLLLQEKLKGTEICVFAIAVDGAVLACSYYRPAVRYQSGASVYYEPVEDPELHARTVRFLQRIRYTGQIGMDVMKTAQGYAVMDCNPRGTNGIHLLAPDALPNALAGQGTPWGLSEVKCHKAALWAFRPQLSVEPGVKVAFHATDVVWDRSDWQPWFGQFISLIEFARRARRHKVDLKGAMTEDIAYSPLAP